MIHELFPKLASKKTMTISSKLPSVYLRVAIGSAYLFEVADRFGAWGHYGQPHVSWGDWQHFVASTHQVLNFLPESVAPTFAVLATLGEGIFGLLVFIGLFTRWAAIGSCLLSFCFALSMALSAGIDSPLGYSVFTLSAASLLLASLPDYPWSVDGLSKR